MEMLLVPNEGQRQASLKSVAVGGSGASRAHTSEAQQLEPPLSNVLVCNINVLSQADRTAHRFWPAARLSAASRCLLPKCVQTEKLMAYKSRLQESERSQGPAFSESVGSLVARGVFCRGLISRGPEI